MEAGIKWTWTTFPEFLDALESLPKGINYSGYIGHSALRTYVMGERAFDGKATEDDLQAMEREVRDAIRAGAMGFTTSRSPAHETPDGRPVASRAADVGRGAAAGRRDGRAERGHLRAGRRGRRPRRRAIRACASTTCGCATSPWRPAGRSPSGCSAGAACPTSGAQYLALLDETAAAGGRMFAQVHSRSLSRAALVQDPDAVRPLARVEGAPRSAARRAAAKAARSRPAPPADRGIRRARQPAARSAPRRGRPTTTGCSSSTPWKARIARWRRSRASAASIRPRP